MSIIITGIGTFIPFLVSVPIRFFKIKIYVSIKILAPSPDYYDLALLKVNQLFYVRELQIYIDPILALHTAII